MKSGMIAAEELFTALGADQVRLTSYDSFSTKIITFIA